MDYGRMYKIKTDDDRLQIWQAFQKVEKSIGEVKAIVQNPTIFDSDDLNNFYSDINSIRDSLVDIEHMVNDKKEVKGTWDEDAQDWSFVK